MITSLLLNFLIKPITALFSFAPHSSGLGLNSLAGTITGSSFFPHLGWINDYFPLDTALTCLTVIFATLGTMLLVNVAIWIYHQLPWVGGGNG